MYYPYNMKELAMDRIPPGESILARMAKTKEQSEIIQEEPEAIELKTLYSRQAEGGTQWTREDAKRMFELEVKLKAKENTNSGGHIMEKDRKR